MWHFENECRIIMLNRCNYQEVDMCKLVWLFLLTLILGLPFSGFAQDTKEQEDTLYWLIDKNGKRSINQWFETHYGGFGNDATYEGFYKAVQEFDPAGVAAKIKFATSKWPEEYPEGHWVHTELSAFLDDMRTNGFMVVKAQAEQMLATGQEFLTKGEVDNAVRAQKLAGYLVNGILLFNTDNQLAMEFKAKLDSQKQALLSILKKFHTSEFHTQQAGKIVFSSKPLVTGGKEAVDVKGQFKDTDTVFGMAYLNSTLSSIEKGLDQYMIRYLVDSEMRNGMSAAGNIFPGKLENTWLSFPILVGPKDSEMMFPAQIIQNLASRQKNGTCKVTLQLTTFALGYDEKILAEGSFTLEIGDIEKLKQRADDHRKAAVARARVPAGIISSPSIEADMKSLMQQNFNETIITLRATVGEPAWNVVKDDWDIPKYRYIRGFIAFKIQRTGKVYYRGIAIMQSHEGSNSYNKKSSLYDPNEPYDLYEMELANVSK